MAWNEEMLKLSRMEAGRILGLQRGLVYSASALFNALAAGANNFSVFITGAKPVVFFERDIGRTGSGVAADIFRAPSYTGGTTVQIYNTNDAAPVATTVSVLTGVTITTTGTQIVPTSYAIGNASNQGQGGTALLGQPIIMQPNTTYLLRFTNLDAAAANFAAQIFWYEGSL